MTKKATTTDKLKIITFGISTVTIGGGVMGLGSSIAGDGFPLFQFMGYGAIVSGLGTISLGLHSLWSVYDMMRIKKSYSLSYAIEEKSPVTIGGVLDFLTPSTQRKQVRNISKLDQIFTLEKVKQGNQRVSHVPGRVIFNFIKQGYEIQERNNCGSNGKPIGGFSLGSWQGKRWGANISNWNWSKRNWSTVSNIVKMGCIEYHRLTGFVLASGLGNRQTFKLLVNPDYVFDALCIALLKDRRRPAKNWQWLAEIMPPPAEKV